MYRFQLIAKDCLSTKQNVHACSYYLRQIDDVTYKHVNNINTQVCLLKCAESNSQIEQRNVLFSFDDVFSCGDD